MKLETFEVKQWYTRLLLEDDSNHLFSRTYLWCLQEVTKASYEELETFFKLNKDWLQKSSQDKSNNKLSDFATLFARQGAVYIMHISGSASEMLLEGKLKLRELVGFIVPVATERALLRNLKRLRGRDLFDEEVIAPSKLLSAVKGEVNDREMVIEAPKDFLTEQGYVTDIPRTPKANLKHLNVGFNVEDIPEIFLDELYELGYDRVELPSGRVILRDGDGYELTFAKYDKFLNARASGTPVKKVRKKELAQKEIAERDKWDRHWATLKPKEDTPITERKVLFKRSITEESSVKDLDTKTVVVHTIPNYEQSKAGLSEQVKTVQKKKLVKVESEAMPVPLASVGYTNEKFLPVDEVVSKENKLVTPSVKVEKVENVEKATETKVVSDAKEVVVTKASDVTEHSEASSKEVTQDVVAEKQKIGRGAILEITRVVDGQMGFEMNNYIIRPDVTLKIKDIQEKEWFDLFQVNGKLAYINNKGRIAHFKATREEYKEALYQLYLKGSMTDDSKLQELFGFKTSVIVNDLRALGLSSLKRLYITLLSRTPTTYSREAINEMYTANAHDDTSRVYEELLRVARGDKGSKLFNELAVPLHADNGNDLELVNAQARLGEKTKKLKEVTQSVRNLNDSELDGSYQMFRDIHHTLGNVEGLLQEIRDLVVGIKQTVKEVKD